MQNRVLKIIKHFPLKTSIKTIHKELKIDKVEERANQLFIKFIKTREKHELIAQEINDYMNRGNPQEKPKFKTPLDALPTTQFCTD
jgi:hypothetical protein